MNLLVQMRKTGFGLGFILGGLFMAAVMLWTGQAHAHDFKQGAIVIYHPYPANNPGISEFTGDADDEGKFRTPSLRNVALTAPYMHDGSIPTLEAVIRTHYAMAGRAGSGKHGPSPLRSSLVEGFEVSDQEVKDLGAFLSSLSDTTFTQNPRHADPWQHKK